MDINIFKTFIIVAKCQSISMASEKVYLTQPAVTKQIKALQEEYEVQLFERKTRKMILTEEGKHLLGYAHRIVDIFKESKMSINEKSGQVKGPLHMGANLTLGIHVLPKLLGLFSDTYPDLKIEIIMDNTDNIIKAVKNNDVNFGFIGIHIDDDLIAQHLIFNDKICVVIGKSLGIKKKVLSWDDLKKIPFIGREKGSDIRATCEEWLKMRDMAVTPKIELNSTEAIKKYIQSGSAFSFLPWSTIEKEVNAGTLCMVSAPHFNPTQNFYICHYKHKKFSKPERLFLEFIFKIVESEGAFFSLPTPPS
jgi:DNA-binding transcriptional LysR family regulator